MMVIGIIPARMASSRFPGKPLSKIIDTEMLGHVFFRSRMSKRLDGVYVATCDKEISDYMAQIDGNVIMTSDKHERASDRSAEALLKAEEALGKKADIVVMIQGDEPMLRPEMIDEAVAPLLHDDSIMVSNLMAPIKTAVEHDDPNEIKVVTDQNGNAFYFSRAPIPSRYRLGEDVPMNKQVCIIPFRRDFLLKFNELPPTPLEQAESVDMMRVLEHGYKVKMVPTRFDVYSVDTETDRQKVEQLMQDDDLIKRYQNQ